MAIYLTKDIIHVLNGIPLKVLPLIEVSMNAEGIDSLPFYVWIVDNKYRFGILDCNKITPLNQSHYICEEAKQVVNNLPLNPQHLLKAIGILKLSQKQEITLNFLKSISRICNNNEDSTVDSIFSSLRDISALLTSMMADIKDAVRQEEDELVSSLQKTNSGVKSLNFNFTESNLQHPNEAWINMIKSLNQAIASNDVDEIKITGLKALKAAPYEGDYFAYSSTIALESIGLTHRYCHDTAVFNGITHAELEDICRTVAYKVGHNLSLGYPLNVDADPLFYTDDKVELNVFHTVKYLMRILEKYPNKQIATKRDKSLCVVKIEKNIANVTFFFNNSTKHRYCLDHAKGIKDMKELLQNLVIITECVDIPTTVDRAELL